MRLKEEKAKWQNALACVLALIAGYSDAYLYVRYKLYASFMSGNTTQAGLRIGELHFSEAAKSFLPIPCFCAGVFVGTLIEHSRAKRFERRITLALTAALIAVVMFAESFDFSGYLSVATLSAAMGVLNTTLAKVGAQSVSLGYVTGVINNFAKNLALAVRGAPIENAQGSRDTHLRRVLVLFSVWAAFLTGALLAGLLLRTTISWALLAPPVLILLTLAAGDGKNDGDSSEMEAV